MATTTIRTTTADQVAIGERFGFYEAMTGSTFTAAELAERTGASVGFVNEWLASQVSQEFVTFDSASQRYANFCSWPRSN
jgi:hypothetical protein